MTLQKLMGLDLSRESSPWHFGMRVKKVAFKAGRILLETLESSNILYTSSLIRSHKWWKKFTVNPSRLGDLPFVSWKTTSSTSTRDIGFIKSLFCSWETIRRDEPHYLFESPLLPYLGSNIISLKYWFKVVSISSLVSIRSPMEFLIENIFFCIMF